MNEQKIKRNIFEAGKDSEGKAITFTVTFRGYTAQESLGAEKMIEDAWEKMKELLQLKDLPEDEAAEAQLRRYQKTSHSDGS